jgi:integrase
MQKKKLTKRTVDAIKPEQGDCFLWDSELAGFGLRVRGGGSKTFIAQYRAGGGRTGQTRRFTIGRYGTLTVEEARLEARKILLAAAQGQDPAGNRQIKRKELRVSEMIDHFEKKGSGHLKERNRRYMMARLQHHVVPLLGRKKISEVRISDVEQMMRDVKAGRTAKNEKVGYRKRVIVSGGAGAATKAVRDLSAVYTFAIRQEWVKYNPCAPVKKPADQRRSRFLTLEEVKRLGAAFTQLEANSANPKAIAIMRLWALTGCRRDEIAGLKWSEIDFDRACLMLSDTKTGRSVRPLASAAVAILKSQTLIDGSDFVFPSDADPLVFYQGTKRHWASAIKLAKLPGVSPHTLRHTVGSAAVSTGETLAMTGALLGHASQQATSIYAHMQQDPARRAADRVVTPIATALGVSAGADVLSIKEPRKASA